MTDLLGLDFSEAESAPPAGNAARFGGRWRLVGAGLSDVWRYGDLELPAASGRLLLRGPNGTGKTTALEVLWPYVLDLNAAKLGAGKARFTSLKLLMSEGARSKRRYGHVWLTFAAPSTNRVPTANASGDVVDEVAQATSTDRFVSYGVRLQFSEGASPAVKPIGFTVPGQPLRTLPLHGEHRSALELEQFTELVTAAGGRVFTDDDDAYVDDLARTVWGTTAPELRTLAGRLREVRNPSLLGDVSPRGAADALRASLPGVDPDVLAATADALDASNTTREAFARDREASTVLADFSKVWAGHAVDIVRSAHEAAVDAATVSGQLERDRKKLDGLLGQQTQAEEQAGSHVDWLELQISEATADLSAIEKSDAYKSSGRLADLDRTGRAERDKAVGDLAAMLTAAEQAATSTASHQGNLNRLSEDLTDVCTSAAGLGADPVSTVALLHVSPRPRSTYTVAGRSANPGPGLTVTVDLETFAALPATWRQVADTARKLSERAGLALTDHRSVETAAEGARDKEQDAVRAAEAFDKHASTFRRSEQAAQKAQTVLLDEAAAWAPKHPALRGLSALPSETVDTPDANEPAQIEPASITAENGRGEPEGTWDGSDVAALREQEPGAVLDVLAGWASQAVRVAERSAAANEQEARNRQQAAVAARAEAKTLRAEAARRRAGELLALPRPSWIGPADDSRALGSALEWATDVPRADRDALELALADSGLLSAALDASGAATSAWRVTPAGPAVESNLTAVLASDPAHPQAATVTALLRRIALVPSARPHDGSGDSNASTTRSDATNSSWPALLIGRDGTWRAGVLLADSVQAAEQRSEQVPQAAHVGARQRREAALREADRLDEQAKELLGDADADEAAARDLRAQAKILRAAAATFPNDRPLRDAEATRVSEARRHAELDQARELADTAAARAQQSHADELAGWTARTTGRDLPTDLTLLRELVSIGQARVQQLTDLAVKLERRHLPRLKAVLGQLDDEAAVASKLSHLASVATASHQQASKTERELDQLRTNAGQDINNAVAQHAQLTEERGEADEELPGARRKHMLAQEALVRTRTLLTAADASVAKAQPGRIATTHRLRRLLAVPAVTEVLLIGIALDNDDDDVLEQLEAVLTGRRTTPRHLVGQRYDSARAALARTWTLARGDAGEGLTELDMYVLTHAEHEYTPSGAALKAEQLAVRAQEQLAAAEQSALTDFVIGQLPSAIGTAWVDLRDWRHDVNRKMRAAAASSGVGVQVETPLRDDLDDATRTVYRLCCQTSDAERTAQDKVEVGKALQALLAAAEGETMLDRLSAAVDLTAWVDVHYLVTRPGKTATRWNQRTGLSGGERRLVVLAPMLAAIAANYDRLGPTGLRLAALDEVPAEVDERGREGLARYIAELDLDLLCTSYLWDGAPGAWDGIDAHDLEAGPDGTVVAFPMLVRGLLPLPGDTDEPEP